MDLDSLLQAYDTCQRAQPLLTSVVQGTIVFTAAEAIAQGITDHRIDKRKLQYTAALSPLYGAGVYGLIQSGEAVGALLSSTGAAETLGFVGTAFLKGALGPNLFGNVQNAAFFYNNTAGTRSNYTFSGFRDAYESLLISARETGLSGAWSLFKAGIPKEEYRKSVIGSVTAWNAIQLANYAWVPEGRRSLVGVLFVIPWMIGLSLWSLKGRENSTIATEK